MSSSPKRKPGAQPGNRNAFRHGLYSNSFTEAEMQSLDEKDESELVAEIALARHVLARLISQLNILKERKSHHV